MSKSKMRKVAETVASKIVETHHAFWEHTALVALVMELIGIGLYGLATNSFPAFAILVLLALSTAAGGGILGFLFGVPKLRPDAKTESDYVSNTNLEQVSDWLTKIIIGATLVQLGDIDRAIGSVAASVGGDIGKPGNAATAVTTCVMVYSFIGGFMWSYLWTSVRLKHDLDESLARRTAALPGKGGKTRPAAEAAGKRTTTGAVGVATT